jgi:hypothetical protein
MVAVSIRPTPRPWILTFLSMVAIGLLVQTFHMAEHIAQVVQKFYLHITPAHGLIGQLDLEPIHFWFNFIYLAFLLMTVVGWFLCRKDVSKCTNYWRTYTFLLLVGMLIQTWHMTEHSVKLTQFLHTGMQGTPGILGNYFDPVLLHFVYNLIVYLPLVIIFFGARLYLLPKTANVRGNAKWTPMTT